MTQLMEKALAEINKLPADQQDTLAAWILDELASEQQWDEAFARSHDLLEELADEALQEHRAGKTRRLNLDEL